MWMPWHRFRCRSTRQFSVYGPGSKERAKIESALGEMASADPIELTATIDGVSRPAAGDPFDVTMPSDHSHILGHAANATRADATEAIDAALAASSRMGRAGLRAAGSGFPACRRPACRALAGHLERSNDARSGKDRAAGRNRCGLRADRLLAVQCRVRAAHLRRSADLITRSLEQNRLSAARGLRLRHYPVQLHRDCGQSANLGGPDGERGDLEAEPDPTVGRAFHHAAIGGGGPAARRDQHAAR